MNTAKIQNRIITLDNTILDALKQMDRKKMKLLIVLDNQQFQGLLSIGDIQRAIIKNVNLQSPISLVLDKEKEYAYTGDSMEQIKQKMFEMRAECMPILDDQNNLVDVYFWSDFFASEKRNNGGNEISVPVVIMAGGKGSRLKPLTNVIPKPLIPVGEKTILEVILDQFINIGCKSFFLSVNYKFDMLKYYIDNLEYAYDISYFIEEKPLGTIGSVALLKDKIKTPFFVSNCDIYIDQDLREVYNYHINNRNEITIVTAVKNFQIPYGVIKTAEEGLLADLSEKPNITYMINTGIYILNAEMIEEIPHNEFFHITDLISKVRARNGRVGCFPVSEHSWFDIGDWPEYMKLLNIKSK